MLHFHFAEEHSGAVGLKNCFGRNKLSFSFCSSLKNLTSEAFFFFFLQKLHNNHISSFYF